MSEQKDIRKKKVDTQEFTEAMMRLPEEEKFKIFYMIKGMELKNEDDKHAI